MTQHGPSRRAVLLGAVALPALALTACGSSGPVDFNAHSWGPMTLQLPGRRDVQFAGSYLADIRGHYIAEGFTTVTLAAPGTDATTRFALTTVENVQSSQVIVGAQYRRSPYCVLSMAAAPITSPAQLAGKRIGVQDVDQPVWQAFARAASVRDVTVAPVGLDPLDLTRGAVDARLAFLPREPNVLLSQGFRVTTMPLAEHGYTVPGGAYVVDRAYLAAHRDVVKAFLRAEIGGWKDVLADPDYAAEQAMKYGAGLGLSLDVEQRQAKAQNELVAQRELFTLDTSDERFDLGPLREIYDEDPSMAAA